MTFLPVSQVVRRILGGRKDVFGGGRREWRPLTSPNMAKHEKYQSVSSVRPLAQPPPTELQLAICKYELLTLNRRKMLPMQKD